MYVCMYIVKINIFQEVYNPLFIKICLSNKSKI